MIHFFLLRLAGLLINKNQKNYQLLYQVINCIWLLSFNKKIAAEISKTKIIARLSDVLKNVPREKIVRMTVATFVVTIENNSIIFLKKKMNKRICLTLKIIMNK